LNPGEVKVAFLSAKLETNNVVNNCILKDFAPRACFN